MSKIDKSTVMATVGQDYAVILAASKEVEKLEDGAGVTIAQIVKDHGPGPHKLPMPDGSVMVATFRKDGKRYKISAVPLDSIT
jgi:hypothetical protein